MEPDAIPNDAFLAALRFPRSISSLTTLEWDVLLRQARRTRVLSRIAFAARERGLLEELPEKIQDHFLAASVIAANHERTILWEINRVRRALVPLEVPIVLLKGAAYVAARLPPARGRLVSDIDIMVPERSLAAVQGALERHGWEPMKLDPYDQRYYRLWMHELAPLRHRERGTVVDVHHTILPKTSRLKPNPDKLWDNARPLERSRLYTLAPTDMVLHSAAHLFHDGDLNLAIRDVADISDLLKHFGTEPAFWQALIPRARELDLARPLFYALRYASWLMGTPVPEQVMRAARTTAPPGPVLAAMDYLVPRVLLPENPDQPRRNRRKAVFLFFIRSHWLRMPPLLLAAHLTRKSLKRFFHRREAPA